MGDDKQLAQEHAGLIWNIFYGICGAIVTGITMLLRINDKIKNSVSRDELKAYVSKEAFNEYKADNKDDFERVDDRFERIETQIAESRQEIIKVIRETR